MRSATRTRHPALPGPRAGACGFRGKTHGPTLPIYGGIFHFILSLLSLTFLCKGNHVKASRSATQYAHAHSGRLPGVTHHSRHTAEGVVGMLTPPQQKTLKACWAELFHLLKLVPKIGTGSGVGAGQIDDRDIPSALRPAIWNARRPAYTCLLIRGG